MNKRLKLFDLLKQESSSLFENSHSIHTPKDLTIDILSKLDLQDKKILVLFNPEFVISLVELYNIPASNIIFYSDHLNKNLLVSKFNVKYIKELETTMKFDVIVGNPPYQDNKEKKSSGTNNLWPLFIEKSIDLLNENGHLAFITPATWMRKSRDILRKKELGGSKRVLTDFFQPNNLIYVNIGGAKKYFPNVGSTFTHYILQKAPYSGKTKIEVSNKIINLDIRSVESLPYILDTRAISIFCKVQQTSEKWNFSSVETFKNKPRQEIRNNEYKYPYLNYKTNNTLSKTDLGVNIVYGNEKHPCADRRKVVVPYVGPTTPYVDTGEYGVLHSQVYFLKDHETCAGAKSVLQSKLFSFLYSEGMSLHNESGVLNVIGKPDLSKEWSNIDIYNYFNLTQDEIDYIESK